MKNIHSYRSSTVETMRPNAQAYESKKKDTIKRIESLRHNSKKLNPSTRERKDIEQKLEDMLDELSLNIAAACAVQIHDKLGKAEPYDIELEISFPPVKEMLEFQTRARDDFLVKLQSNIVNLTQAKVRKPRDLIIELEEY